MLWLAIVLFYFFFFLNSWFVHKSPPLWYKNWLFCCLYLPALLAENISLGYSHTKYLIKVTTASFYRLCCAPLVCSPSPIAHTSEWIFPLHFTTPLRPQQPAFHTATPERKNYVNKELLEQMRQIHECEARSGEAQRKLSLVQIRLSILIALVWVRYDYDVNGQTVFRMKVHNESSLALGGKSSVANLFVDYRRFSGYLFNEWCSQKEST